MDIPGMPVAPNVALWIEGVGAQPSDVVAQDATGRHLMQALQSLGRWSVRVAAAQDGEHLPTRIGIKQAIRRAIAETTGRLLIALRVKTIQTKAGPALVTDPEWEAFPEDSTLELAWLRSELRDVEARMILLLVTLVDSEVPQQTVFEALDVGRPDRLLAVVAGAGSTATLCREVEAVLSPTSEVTLEGLASVIAEELPTSSVALHGDSLARVRPPSGMTIPLGKDALKIEALEPLEHNPAPAPLLGTTLPGRFRLTREIARGAHGVVYAARQLSVNRLVAVKVLDAQASNSGRYNSTNFVDEIQTIGQLDHPNVVRIYQADRTPDGRMFYAMELVRGPTLETLLDQHGPLSIERAVAFVQQILSGLQAAHLAGVVHSDVKPSNIALQPTNTDDLLDARAVIFDFGVARLRHNNPHRISDAIGASMAYTAPEQAFDGKVDVRSDIFAVGLLLYSMITGWERGSLDEMLPPLTPATIPDPHLLSVLRRALSYDANERYESAGEFLAGLAGGSVSAREDVAMMPPFRYLSQFSEADRGRFHGRVLATAQFTDLVVYNDVVALAGPSAAGKTSLVRAGLLPRLRSLRVHTVYVRCDEDPVADAATGLVQGERDLLRAVRAWREEGSARVVILFDEVGALLQSGRTEAAAALMDTIVACAGEEDAGVGFVLIVDDDALGMLQPLVPRLASAPPLMRLGPLTTRGAAEALLRPLEDRDITVAPAGLERLMVALSGGEPSSEWSEDLFVDAAELQLVGSLLYDALPAGFTGEISAEQCDAVLPVASLVERWLKGSVHRIMRGGVGQRELASVLRAMVGEGGEALARNEAELGDIEERCTRELLDELVAEQLLIRRSRPGLLPTWQLVHKRAVQAVQAWLSAL
ncbi:MAG: protein kinase domain-containing protein [Myxococcota bacterium]